MKRSVSAIAASIAGSGQRLRFRFGSVVSVQADQTCTITVGGDTTQVSGIRYANLPMPGATVILATDGLDMFVVGHLAGDGSAHAPRASRSTDQSIATATDTAVSFAAVDADPWGAWSAGTPTRLTAPVTGRFMAVGVVQFAANATGLRSAWLELTGAATLARVQVAALSGSPTMLTVTSAPFDMTAATDYVTLKVRQESGGALAATAVSAHSPSLALIYLGP